VHVGRRSRPHDGRRLGGWGHGGTRLVWRELVHRYFDRFYSHGLSDFGDWPGPNHRSFQRRHNSSGWFGSSQG
jgi:hypothetical protein